MMTNKGKLAVVVGLTVATVLGAATTAFAALGAASPVTAKLKTSTVMTVVGKIDSVPITITCTNFHATGTSRPPGPVDTITLAASPTVNGCTDSLHGTDTITTNNTNGHWRFKGSGAGPSSVYLYIPEKGATFTSSIEPDCTVTWAPTGPDPVEGSYVTGTGVITYNSHTIAVASTGCTARNWKVTAKVVLSPLHSGGNGYPW